MHTHAGPPTHHDYRYESVIHEFDPYFNFRTTKVSPFFPLLP